jgi:lipid A 4'-phosphatase
MLQGIWRPLSDLNGGNSLHRYFCPGGGGLFRSLSPCDMTNTDIDGRPTPQNDAKCQNQQTVEHTMSEQDLPNSPELTPPELTPSSAVHGSFRAAPENAVIQVEGPPVVFIATASGFIASLVFVGFPGIDIFAASLFHTSGNDFMSPPQGLVEGLRFAVGKVFFLFALGVATGFLLFAFSNLKLVGFDFAKWSFLALALLLGPLLVANGVFKSEWGRARPSQLQQFGGDKIFSPALIRTDQCDANCSFVSGEVSSTFTMVFAPALLVMGRRRREVMAAALAAGAFMGLLRMAAGGHFLSDVIFAMVFCALTTNFAHWLVFQRRPQWFADDGPIRTRIQNFGHRAKTEGPEAYQKLRSRMNKRGQTAASEENH